MEPTDDDLSRCAAADLAVCEAATPGEWTTDTEHAVGLERSAAWAVVSRGGLVCTDGNEHYKSETEPPADLAFIALARTALPAWIRRAQAAEAEVARLRDALARQNHEIEQTLGKALGYPPLYPDVSPVDDGQVCVGDHVAETLALEAADRITRLRDAREAVVGHLRKGGDL
jgi:hypothetical protein